MQVEAASSRAGGLYGQVPHPAHVGRRLPHPRLDDALAICQACRAGRQGAHPGQSVRLLDVPVRRGEHGAWQNLHGLPSEERFSDEIKRAALTHYGHAGRAFLEKLTRDTRNFSELS